MPFKLSKVSHPGLNLFHRNIPPLLLLAILISSPHSDPKPALISTHPMASDTAKAPADCLYEPAQDSLILHALDRLYAMDYAQAETMLERLPGIPARAYFRGLVLVNRFNDLGDTSALFKAQALWDSLDLALDSLSHLPENRIVGKRAGNGPGLYLGLTELQLSYVAGVTGRQVRAARLASKAVGRLDPFADIAEAEAALALYEYYRASLLKGVDWVPFVKADQNGPLTRLEGSIPRSRYLRDILQTTLLWLYYDRGQYDAGLSRIGAFLARYPQNRLYRQIQADFLFRKGDVKGAQKIHESLKQEYLGMNKAYPAPIYLPIGYLSSVGNLAKIYSASKRLDSLQAQLAIWQAPDSKRIMDWLPASLKREVKSLKK